jgi:hypothetical protein
MFTNLRFFMPKKDGSPNAREIDALVKFDRAVQMQNVRLADRQHDEEIGAKPDRDLEKRIKSGAEKLARLRPPKGFASFEELRSAVEKALR